MKGIGKGRGAETVIAQRVGSSAEDARVRSFTLIMVTVISIRSSVGKNDEMS